MLLDFLFPRTCVGCWKKWEYLCSECKKELYSHPEICPFCHQKSPDFQTCKACSESQILKWIIIWFAYKWVAKKLILKAKFAHKKDVIPFLAERLSLLIISNQELKLKLENYQLFVYLGVPLFCLQFQMIVLLVMGSVIDSFFFKFFKYAVPLLSVLPCFQWKVSS